MSNSYNRRWFHEFNDRYDRSYRIEIDEKNGTSDPKRIDASGEPIQINHRKVSDHLEPIRGSEAVFRALSPKNFEFKDLFAAKRGDYVLKLKSEQTVADLDSGPYLEVSSQSSLQLGDKARTFEFWVKFDELADFNQLISKWSDEYLVQYKDSNNRIRFLIKNGTTNTIVTSTTPIKTDNWYHVLAKHDPDNDNITISVNNETTQSTTVTGGANSSGNSFRIGEARNSEPHDGQIANVRIYDKVTTDTEDDWLWNSGEGRSMYEMGWDDDGRGLNPIHAWNLEGDWIDLKGGADLSEVGNVGTTKGKEWKLEWAGVNIPDIYSEPYEPPPYPVDIRFTDGLKFLENIDWDDTNNDLFVQNRTLIEIFRLALNKLPLRLHIREFVNIYEESINDGISDSMWDQIYLLSEGLWLEETQGGEIQTRGLKSLDIIKNILKTFGAHIIQQNGIWRIVREQEKKKNKLHGRQFAPKPGNESDTGVDASFTEDIRKEVKEPSRTNDKTDIWFLAFPDLDILEKVERIKVVYDMESPQLEKSNLIKNQDFENIDDSSLQRKEWTPYYWSEASSWDTSSFELVNRYALHFPLSVMPQATGSIGLIVKDPDKYIKQDGLTRYFEKSDSIRVIMHIKAFADTSSISDKPQAREQWYKWNENLFVHIPFRVNFNGEYLSGNNQDGFSWSGSADDAEIKIRFDQTFPNIWGMDLDDVFKFVSPLISVPINQYADTEFRIYAPYTNLIAFNKDSVGGNINGVSGDTDVDLTVWITKFEVKYKPDGNAPDAKQVRIGEITPDSTTEKIELNHADGHKQDVKGYKLSDNSPTKKWSRRYVNENKPLIDIFADQYFDLKGDYSRILKGTLAGDIEPTNKVIERVGVSSNQREVAKYSFIGKKWNVKSREHEVHLVQIGHISVNSTITEAIDEIKPEPGADDSGQKPIVDVPEKPPKASGSMTVTKPIQLPKLPITAQGAYPT